MKLFKKDRHDHISDTLNEIYDVADMLERKGEYDGKCRYLEIMTKELLLIQVNLSYIRTALSVGIGLVIGHFLSQLLARI